MAGYTWKDVGSQRFPIDQFINFIAYAPPGTALFHQRNHGWLPTDHLLAQAIDALHMLAWMQSADAQQKRPKHRPKPMPRPGVKVVERVDENKSMTVEEYAAKVGMVMNFGEG